ncbi:GNAT family N-acetyltransferase [Actinocatenispora comari]|uniref:GNAT family N-acetyltransferase n=1 Tax=Actinocatenispora comari TaxID=2807577 RepID=A0A8J4AGT8_9ACTN|nr:GNAT family N-acetyltransferase [Actinocatenispora comari]GIL29412.1 GNAT family N-acetyltransferase [Actinocatenispora comari]
MSRELRIRPVHATDVDAVVALLEQLGYPQRDRAATAVRIRSWHDDPSATALVADDGGAPLGIVAVQICPYFERDGAWARITALVVRDRVRRRGVGSRLVAAAERFAIGHGCTRMEVTSAARRGDAHAFYRRHGYADQAGVSSRFLRELGTDTDR